MPGLLDIGTLSGSIVISEKIAETAGRVNSHLDSIGAKFEGITSTLLLGSAAIVGALGGIAAGIVTLGEKGSTILGVEEAFDRLAISIGETGDALIGGLSEGVRNTVDSFELMKSANRALSAGVKLTAEDMKLLGSTAREMAKAAGTDAASELEKLFRAMTTGQTRAIKLAGVTVDLEGAQRKLAESLGTTADKLNREGQLHAARNAILEGARRQLDRLGESQLSFKERIDQAQVAFGNWVDELSKAIARSPAVMKAFDDIARALGEAFGDKGRGLIDSIMVGIDAFAAGVSRAAQFIVPLKDGIVAAIDVVKGFWNWLVDLNNQFGITDKVVVIARASFNFLRQAFDLVRMAALAIVDAWRQMPPWLQEIAKTAIIAGAGLTAIGVAARAVASPVAALVGQIDQAINIFGNLSSGIYSTNLLLGAQWKAIGNSTTVIAGYLVATNSMTVATNFWTAAMVRAETMLLGLAQSTGLLTVAQRVATGATALLTASKTALAGILSFVVKETMAGLAALSLETAAQRTAQVATGLLVGVKTLLVTATNAVTGSMTALAARLGLTSVALNVTRLAAGATTVAMGVLGTALLALTSIPFLGALTLLIASLGELKKAFTDLKIFGGTKGFLEVITQKDEDNWVRRMLGIGQAARDMREKLQNELQAAADAQKRWIADMTGATGAAELQTLHNNWNALTDAQKLNVDVLKRVGEEALNLRNKGVPLLDYTFNTLADAAERSRMHVDKLSGPGGTSGLGLLKTTISATEQSIRGLVDELSGAKLKAAVDELNVAWSRLNEEQQRNPQTLELMLSKIKSLVAQGGLPLLSKEAHTLWRAHLAMHDMIPKVNQDMSAILNTSRAVTVSYREQERALEDLRHSHSRFHEFDQIVGGDPFSVFKNISGGITSIGASPNLFKQFFLDIKNQFTAFGKELGPTILAALTGGGDVGRSVGGLAGGFLGKSLVTTFSGALSKLGSTLGGAIGSIIPGLGTLAGAAIGAMFDKIPWNTIGKNVARNMQDAFATGIGFVHLDALNEQLRRMGEAGAKLAQAGDRAQRRDDEKATRQWMEDVQKFLAELDSDIQRYKLSWSDLSDPFERMKKSVAGADALVATFDRLKGAGFSVASITKGMAGDLNAWLKSAIDAGTGIPPQIGKIIEQLVISKQLTEENARALLGLAGDGMPSLADITEAAGRYGLKLDELGPKVQQLSITEQANQIVKDFDLLMKAGVPFEVLFQDIAEGAENAEDEVGQAAKGMLKSVQDLVSKALTEGLKLPESMRGIIDRLIAAGKLTDEFGDKLVDTSRLQFEVPLVDRISDLILAIRDLVDEFKKLSPAIETEVNKSITIWGRLRGVIGQPLPTPAFTPPAPPSSSSGPTPEPTNGFMVPQPVPVPGGAELSGANINIMALDSKSFAEWLAQGNNAEITAHGIAPVLPKVVEFYHRGEHQ